MSRFIRTIPRPRRFYTPADWTLAIPTSESIPSNRTGGPYAGGELKYLGNNAANIAQSEAAELLPNVGDYADRDWLFPQRGPDGKWELVFRASIWGSPSSPFSGSDHTRTELRGIKPGPTNSGSTRGDFKIADRMFMEGEFRPLRFPNNDRDGSPTGANNLTTMQLHPVDSLDDAATTVFSIMALRKNGQLQCTMTNADGTNAATTHGVPIILLSNVQLGDVITYELTTEADRLEWRAENKTRAPGTIITLTQPIPNVSSNGVTQRTRFQYAKAGCYHATGVDKSTDAPNAVNGVLPRRLVTDFAAVAYRYVRYRYLAGA